MLRTERPKFLLTSVFGPYAVDDDYGEKANLMELFHNQVTREQGIFSYRFNHSSFGLYLLAENIEAPTVVLDFPTLPQFAEELKRGYDYVGISFIMPNFKKAQKMAELARQLAPGTKIILGGHGTAVDEAETAIPHDHICRGEGVSFLRRLFGEDPARPIRHPLLNSAYNRRVMGVPLPESSGILITGVGCPNKCRFCATSHFFGDYIAYLKTGKEIFDVCCAYQDRFGVTDFGVMDENFLKNLPRALELLACMEASGRFFTFGIFSSAETLSQLPSLDLLVRLGVTFVWMGVESRFECYEKNKGVDFARLIAELRKRGVSVLTSAILFLESHTEETLWEDVRFVAGLRPDYLQFMELAPLPGTALYRDYEREGRLCLIDEVPYKERHGRSRIWFRHPRFPIGEAAGLVRKAFEYDYRVNGASLIRAVQTAMWGYEYAAAHDDARVRNRTGGFRSFLDSARLFMFPAKLFAANPATRELLAALDESFRKRFPAATFKQRLLSGLAAVLALKTAVKNRFWGDVIQPPTRRTVYRWLDA